MTKLDALIHVQLYNFGLQFDRAWANPYYTYAYSIYVALSLPFAFSLITLAIGAKTSFNRKIEPTQKTETTMFSSLPKSENSKLPLKKSVPSIKIGIAFIIPGVLAIVYSIIQNSNTLSFIGLSLTFWGALFFFIKPERYVSSSMLTATAISEYMTTDRILRDLKINGKAYHIPPYPKEVYLPQYLKGLKESVVFISASTSGMPSIEELAKGKFLFENPNGICVTPPGLGLLEQLEKELKRDITKLQLTELCEILPPLITENLQLAKDVEIKQEDNGFYLKMAGSSYQNLYITEELKSIHYLGCPLASAIACAIAKTSGKTVTVQKDNIVPDGETVELWYQLVES